MHLLIFGNLPTFSHIKAKPLNTAFNFIIMKIYLPRIEQVIFNSLLASYITFKYLTHGMWASLFTLTPGLADVRNELGMKDML